MTPTKRQWRDTCWYLRTEGCGTNPQSCAKRKKKKGTHRRRKVKGEVPNVIEWP